MGHDVCQDVQDQSWFLICHASGPGVRNSAKTSSLRTPDEVIWGCALRMLLCLTRSLNETHCLRLRSRFISHCESLRCLPQFVLPIVNSINVVKLPEYFWNVWPFEFFYKSPLKNASSKIRLSIVTCISPAAHRCCDKVHAAIWPSERIWHDRIT